MATWAFAISFVYLPAWK